MEEEDIIYKLTDFANSFVDKNIETMDEWITNMSDDELDIFYKMCNKHIEDRSEKENGEISKFAFILYCRELGLNELSISNELIIKITGAFCVNVIIELLRRRGIAKTDGPLLIYKDCILSLTEEGKTMIEDFIEDKNINKSEEDKKNENKKK